MSELDTPFAPDWVSPPGDTVLDIIEERGWTQAELATRLGYSTKHVNQLIKGKVPLTEDAAIRLERVLGSSVGFWLAREARYRERCARLEAIEKYSAWTKWLEELPIRELMNIGIIEKQRLVEKNKPRIVERCLQFFGVASPEEWRRHYGQMQGAFRRSREEQSDLGAISAWLRMGERYAEEQDGPKYDRVRFESALKKIRTLTTMPPEKFEPKLRELFFDAGVAFVLVPAIPKSHVSGVARWLKPQKPLIQLSLYGKTNDKFWFTLFHEAAHILLHASEKSAVFLDDPIKLHSDIDVEHQANEWAGDYLIPKQAAKFLGTLQHESEVCQFAKEIGVHPGIVVGRLQHDDYVPFSSRLNHLKESFCLRSE